MVKSQIKKRYSVKIPKEISVIHCDKKNILCFSGPKGSKSLTSYVKVDISSNSNLVIVSNIPFTGNSSRLTKKKIQMFRGLVVSKIRQIIIEISGNLHRKLQLVGVGYRAFQHDAIPNQIYFKLGFSHPVYFTIPSQLNVKVEKFTKVYIYGGNSIDMLSSTVSNIRNCKLPEPYKGKGILYDQEKILLKKGKKI